MNANPVPRICFLMPYFGVWPAWMPFFLQSCRINPDIDWLFFTDCGHIDSPSNVRFVDISFEDYCRGVAEKLDIPFSPARAYKLCDVKPAYGYLHEKELEGYDFWAFGDIDLVYGRLRDYFTAERLARKDLFSTHPRRVSGHLCIVRNTAAMRTLFFRIKDWRSLLISPEHETMDEGAFSKIFIRRKNWPEPLGSLSRKLNPWYRRAEFIEAYSTPNAKRPWIDGSFNFPQRWFWDEGKLTNDLDGMRQFPYFHFMVWKNIPAWQDVSAAKSAQYDRLAREMKWQISESGFEPLPPA